MIMYDRSAPYPNEPKLREFTPEEKERYEESIKNREALLSEAPNPDTLESVARHCALPADTKITWDW